MSESNFKDRVKTTLAVSGPNGQYEEARQCIRDAAEAIEESVSGTAREVKVLVEPGILANVGQQFNIVLRLPDILFRDVLFRAYVPFDGYPVSLDFFGEELESCEDRTAVEAAIIRFLGAQNVRERLRALAQA